MSKGSNLKPRSNQDKRGRRTEKLQHKLGLEPAAVYGTTLPIFRITHHKLAELEDQFKIASLSSLLASSSNLTGLDSFFFKKLDSSVSC